MTSRFLTAAATIAAAITCSALTGSAARQTEAPACRITGRVTAGTTPLPGVAIVARAGTNPRVTATDVRGAYTLALPPGEYALTAELTGFQPLQRAIAVDTTSCAQTIDLQLVLTPRRASAPAPAAAGRGRGAAPGVGVAAPFQTLEVNADAFGGPPGEQADAALFLPAGFEAEAGADAIAITGNTAQIDRGLLNQRADAFARGELPANIADLAAALQGGGGVPPALAAELAARGGGPGGGGGFVIGGRGGRGNRIQASADYTFGGSMLDSAPYQLRGDAGRSRQPYHRQNFGTQIGGPLRLPGIYRNASNRTSFQASYTAARGANLFDQYATVPTDAMRAGDFSASSGAIVDPITGEPFADNRIPADRISSAAATLLPYIPAPNLPGTTRNFHYTTTTASRNDAVNARIQHTFGGAAGGRGGRGGRGGGGGGFAGRGGRAGQAGQAGRGAAQARPMTVGLNVQMQYRRSDGDQTNVFPTIGGRTQSTSVSVPVGLNITHGRDLHNVNIQMSKTSSSTRNRFAGVTDIAGAAGIAGASTDPFSWGVPALSFSSISGLRDVTPSERDDGRFGISHSWTHPLGRHSVRAGGSLQMDRGTTRTEGNANGSFAFTGLYTSAGGPIVAGSDVADFLLGLPQQAALQYGPGEVTLHGRSFNAFVQDDWRARGNVTVNLGLRYELLWPFIEEHGRLANLDVTPDFSAAAPVLAGGTGVFSGSFPEALLATDGNNLAPRIGVAWRTRGVVLRGGYGISYNSGAYAGFARQMSTQPPFAATNTQIGALNRLLLMESALSVSAADDTENTFAVDRNYALGRVETWNADVQRQLGRSWNVSANYTHTRGSNLDVVRAPNRGPDGLRIDGVAPFLWQTSEGESILHSANFTLQRRPVRGIGWNVAYTVARSRDNAPSIGGGTVVAQDDQNIDAEWGLSNFDRRHRLTASVSAELPFGQNRAWLNGGGPWAALLENWRLNFNLSLESGAPLSARLRNSSRDVAQGQSGALRADYTGAPIVLDDATIDQFFNTSAFLIPAPGAFGNSPRNLIIGPGSRQLDGQISRDVRLGGNRAVTIQVRATNLLNLVNYTAVDTFVNSPTFGQISSVRPMRSAQLNLRFRF